MCEARAYGVSDDGQAVLMENVVLLRQDGDEVVLTDLFGDQLRIRARLLEVQLLDHKILLEPVAAS